MGGPGSGRKKGTGAIGNKTLAKVAKSNGWQPPTIKAKKVMRRENASARKSALNKKSMPGTKNKSYLSKVAFINKHSNPLSR